MLLCGSVFGFTLQAHTIISPPLFFAEPTIPMTSRDALYGVGATPLGFFLPPPHRASFQTTWRNACGWRLARRPDTTLPASHLHLLHVALELARRAVKLCHVVGCILRASGHDAFKDPVNVFAFEHDRDGEFEVAHDFSPSVLVGVASLYAFTIAPPFAECNTSRQ